MVAPIVEKGITELKVYLPEGKWKAFDGKTYKGDKQIIIPVSINDIPYFEKL